MNIMKKSLMLVAIALGAASGIDIPQTNCEWKGADDGVMNTCDGNEIPVGACGSGSFDDSSGQFTQARWVTTNFGSLICGAKGWVLGCVIVASRVPTPSGHILG